MALELIGLAVVANLMRSWVIEEKFGMIPRFVMWLDKWHDEQEEKGKYGILEGNIKFSFWTVDFAISLDGYVHHAVEYKGESALEMSL